VAWSRTCTFVSGPRQARQARQLRSVGDVPPRQSSR
jgi:hypothetical protein